MLAGAACAGLAAVVLVGAIALNSQALAVENGIVSDDAIGPWLLGILAAALAGVLAVRALRAPHRRGVALSVVLGACASALGAIGAVLAIAQPAVFNAGYGCLGSSSAWLAVEVRPTPATCGYLIPAADTALFYPAAYAGVAAAILGGVGAAATFAGRTRRPT